MRESVKNGPIKYYESSGGTLRPGDYIAGELENKHGWTSGFFGTIHSIYQWPDGVYVYFVESAPLKIPKDDTETFEIFRHNKRGSMQDV